MEEKACQSIKSLCGDISESKMASALTYGANANVYRPPTTADMELSSPHCLLLALLHSLVTGDVTSCVFLADMCCQVERLRSRHFRVWLLEDFDFPRADVGSAMDLFVKLVAEATLKLPMHLNTIMSSLAKKYNVPGVDLRTLSQESRCDLAVQLEKAVVSNSPRDILELDNEGGDVHGLTQSGDSLLHLAARNGSSASICALAVLNADLEGVNFSDVTPLEEAVRYNAASSVKALLKAGAKIDKRLTGGDTYLHIAAAGGHNEALQVLLDGGAEVNKKNGCNETPLVKSLISGNVRGIELLIEKGARIKDLSKERFKDGDTIVHCVARTGNIEVLQLLKDWEISANVKNNYELTPLHSASDPSVVTMLIRMGGDVNARDKTGTTPLMMAAKNSHADVVTLLLMNPANPNIKDNKQRTALHYAAETGCIEAVASLLQAGASVNEPDVYGKTPAFVAVINKKPKVLQLIVERGDLSMRDSRGCALLHVESMNGHAEVVKAMLDAGAPVNAKCRDQRTALHYAAEEGQIEVVKVLLAAGALVDLRDRFGKTALHLAAKEEQTAVVAALLDAGADKNMKVQKPLNEIVESQTDIEDFGLTPLMLACKQNCIEVVKLLVDRGVNVNARDDAGRTALKWASSRGGFPRNRVWHYLITIDGIE